MSIELLPIGQRCNLSCSYCYEQPMRDAGNVGDAEPYDFDKMVAGLEAEGVGQLDSAHPGQRTGFTIFGGEPLMLPRPLLDKLGEYARAKGVPLGIQTNGSLVTDWHLAWIQRYSIGVGISVDGPDELNDLRWVASERATRLATSRSIAAIAALARLGTAPSIIVTLSNRNASPERLPRLTGWIRSMIGIGVKHWNFHTLETDNGTESEQLSVVDAVAAARALINLGASHGLEFSPWSDMRRALVGDDEDGVMCIWHACDPLTTNAVRGVDGQGHRKNCGRIEKNGVSTRKADTAGHERQLALYLTPQEFGGCQGCRFFFACGGECPGTAERGDWRFRTAHCATLQATFPILEAAIVESGQTPISLALDRPRIEAALLAAYARGQTPTRRAVLAGASNPSAPISTPHGDAPHGDRPHGDHTDRPKAAAGAREAVTA